MDPRRHMAKKRVVKKLVKKPCPEKGGVVAKRAVRKPLLWESRKKKQRHPIQIQGCHKACRIKHLGSRSRKQYEDKNHRRDVALVGTRQGKAISGYFTKDYYADDPDFLLGVVSEEEITVTVRRTEHHISLCDSVTGDSALPDEE